MGRLSYFIAYLLCVFGVVTSGEAKDLKEYWAETSLTYRDVSTVISKSQCYRSEKSFYACGMVLNAYLAAFQKKGYLLIPSASMSDLNIEVKPVSSGQNLTLIELPEFKASTFTLEKQASKKFDDLQRESWYQLFHQTKQTRGPDFKKSFENYATMKMAPNEFSKPYYAALLINTFSRVTQDPHTYYLPQAFVDSWSKPEEDSFFGAGLLLKIAKHENETRTSIKEVILGGPSDGSGLLPGDIIKAVDGVSMMGKKLKEVVKAIKGPEGQERTFEVFRKGKKFKYSVRVGEVKQPKVYDQVYYFEGLRMGYLKIQDFTYSGMCSSVESIIRGWQEKDLVEGLMIDLRENSGGYVSQATCLENLFLPKGYPVFRTKSLKGGFETTRYATKDQLTQLPLVVLIDASSASASEVFSGGVQDAERAVIVGTQSFGKGTVQRIEASSLYSGLIYKKTTHIYRLPSKRSPQKYGITPDVQAMWRPEIFMDDHHFYREVDYYFALTDDSPQWTSTRPEVIRRLNECVKENRGFEMTHDQKQLGYPFVVGVKTMNCMIQKELALGTQIKYYKEREPSIDDVLGSELIPSAARLDLDQQLLMTVR